LRTEKPYKRTERIEQQILEILGEINVRHINLSHLGFITFTNVTITPDLYYAKIYYSIIKPRIDVEDVTIKLNKLKSAFRKFLGPELHIKHIPDLTFYYDETADYSENIDRLINTLHSDSDDI